MPDNPQHFFLLGAAKCGTLSLYKCLKQHPQICMSEPKEPFFFELDQEYQRGVTDYQSQFFEHHDDEPVMGEARHRNLFLPWVPDRILNYFPDAQFLAILRNPVERAFSHYLHWYRSGRPNTESLPFHEAIYQNYRRIKQGRDLSTEQEKQRYQDHLRSNGLGLYRTYLDSGYYDKQLRRYYNRTDPDRVKVILFESFIDQPQYTMTEIFRFLGIGDHEITLEETHRGKGLRFPWLQRAYSRIKSTIESMNLYSLVPESLKRSLRDVNRTSKPDISHMTKLWLYDHYREHNQRLEDVLDRDLKIWDDKQIPSR